MNIDKETIIKYFDIVLLSDKKDSFFDVYDLLVPKYLKAETTEEKEYFCSLKDELIEFAKYEKYFNQFPNGSCELTDIGKIAKKKGGHFKYDKYIENKDLDNNKVDIKIDNFIGGDNYGIQSSKSDFKSPIKQKTVHKTDNKPNKKSWIEITAWVVGIIIGLISIYEIIIKKLIE